MFHPPPTVLEIGTEEDIKQFEEYKGIQSSPRQREQSYAYASPVMNFKTKAGRMEKEFGTPK